MGNGWLEMKKVHVLWTWDLSCNYDPGNRCNCPAQLIGGLADRQPDTVPVPTGFFDHEVNLAKSYQDCDVTNNNGQARSAGRTLREKLPREEYLRN